MDFDYEASMKRIEEITVKLEDGELALEESLKLFEEAAGLIKSCSSFLYAAEQRVKKLVAGE
jgi:exodeoxyribonuclease VII small subunit